MNNTQCSNCNKDYSFANPPKKLKNCPHSMCDACLPTAVKCPLDQKRVQYRRYTAKAFQINHEILDLLQKPKQSPKKIKTAIFKQSSPKKQYQVCLLHSKPADIICYVDGSLICANCALFGEHRGHAIKNCDQFLIGLTGFTEQALQVFDRLKDKQQNLNQKIITDYVDDCFRQQKNQQLKNIKTGFAKLMQRVKKAQKAAIARIDNQIKQRKQNLLKQISISQLQGKKNQWYKQVQSLGNITQQAYQFRNIQNALRYLDQKSPESFLLKRGQYLHLEYSSSETVIKNKIDTETSKMTAIWNQQIERSIDDYCTFPGSLQIKQSTPCTKLKQSNISRGQKKQEDILIDQVSSRLDLSQSYCRREFNLRPQIENRTGYAINLRIPEVTIAESIHHMEEPTNKDNQKQKLQKMQRSKSNKQKSVSEFNSVSAREILGPVDNKKRKKIDIPEKYKQIFDDLKNDRTQVIDFGGAELGDQNVLALCQYIEKTHKLRNLKLVRNKISDDVVKQLLSACYCAKVTSLNLGQNLLTQKTLEMLEAFDLGELRNITLSLNKINRRNVKQRLQQFVKRGITLSV